MTLVLAWPPVGATGFEWTESAPVNTSRSIITGRRYVSAHARKRRLVSLTISSLSANGAGAGYMEMTKRLLDGGVNLVRLKSIPINRHSPVGDMLQSQPVNWSVAGDDDVDWSNGADASWFTGVVIRGAATPSANGLWSNLQLTGLPPRQLVVQAGDFLTFEGDDGSSVTTQVIRSQSSDATGRATIRVLDPIAGAGRVNIGTSESLVFEAIDIPRAVQPVRGDWSYTWGFREVFADEVAGGFEEVNPWT